MAAELNKLLSRHLGHVALQVSYYPILHLAPYDHTRHSDGLKYHRYILIIHSFINGKQTDVLFVMVLYFQYTQRGYITNSKLLYMLLAILQLVYRPSLLSPGASRVEVCDGRRPGIHNSDGPPAKLQLHHSHLPDKQTRTEWGQLWSVYTHCRWCRWLGIL